MAVSPTLATQLEQLSPQEKAAVADALWRQVDEQWLPSAQQVAELERRGAQARIDPASTLPLGEEVARLRR